MENTDTSPAEDAFAPVVGENNTAEAGATAMPAGRSRADTGSPSSGHVLDLVALVVLIALAAIVFTVAGPAAFTAVTSVGMGLFATWRSTHQRPPDR